MTPRSNTTQQFVKEFLAKREAGSNQLNITDATYCRESSNHGGLLVDQTKREVKLEALRMSLGGKRTSCSKRYAAIEFLFLGGSQGDIPPYLIPSLVSGGFVDQELNITRRSWFEAVSSCLTLRQQCNLLGLPIERITMTKNSCTTEEYALQHFIDNGYAGVWDEGATIGSLHAICWAHVSDKHRLLNLYRPHHYSRWTTPEKHGFILQSKLYWSKIINLGLCDESRLLQDIRSISKTDFLESAERVIEIVNKETKQGRRLTKSMMPANFYWQTYSAMQKSDQMGYIESIDHSHSLTTSGSPDLTLVKSNTVHLVEVKRQDCLTRRQIERMPVLKNVFGFDVRVCIATQSK